MCKKTICFFLLLALFLVGPADAADETLIGWWKLNDESGNTAADSSGYGNDGILHGDPQWVEGILGGALDLDGSGDYVDCGNNPAFAMTTNQMTVAAWVTIRSIPGEWRAAVAKGENAWRLGNVNMDPRFHFGMTWWDQPNPYAVDGGTSVNFNEWHHIAGTFDGANINIYLDGVVDASATTPEPIGTNNLNVFIGDNPEATGRYWDGLIDDVRLYNRALTTEEILVAMQGESFISYNPSPANGATDVPRNVVLAWDPGTSAQTHNVYFGTVFDDVNDASPGDPRGVLVSQNQSGLTYNPEGLLEFSQTYYWRTDGINESEVLKGDVWSFTVEPFAYPIENIVATASSSAAGKGPENTVNGSGLEGDLHSISTDAMWLSEASEPGQVWIKFEFDRIYKLHEMLVWNYNAESILSLYGLKEVTVEYSVDGSEWTQLDSVTEFAGAPGENDYAPNNIVPFNGILAKYVMITANGNQGGGGGFFNQYGLSEVRFLSLPVFAREPSPASGAINIPLEVTLSWRAGREAVQHNVHFSDNAQAIVEGTSLIDSVTETSYDPLSLDLGEDYYWRVDEVNGLEIWESGIWNFKTLEYLVVDDIEDYNDFPPDEIWNTWIDGYNNASNGSTAGYPDPDFTFDEHYVETNYTHGGSQSMPLFYDNTIAAYSEVTASTETLEIGRDWSRGSAANLVLWFAGDPANATTEHMYVKINNVKVLYDGDPGNIAIRRWNLWIVDLLSLGINLNNVTTLGIGFERTGAAGGTGAVFIDDIRLYKTPPPTVEPIDPGTDGLIASYSLENNVLDSSPNGLNGTVAGNPVYVDGAVGRALDFDGTGDYVDCGNSPLFNVTDAITVSTWVNIRSLPQAWSAVVTKGDSAWRISNNNTATSMHFAFTGGTRNNQAANSNTELNLFEWYHICGVYDTNVGAKIYVNGSVDGNNPDTGGITTNNYNVFIGENDEPMNRFWDGQIDEVKIFDRALSDAEVLYLSSQ